MIERHYSSNSSRVSVAASAIHRLGYDGTGVADITATVGLTHGALYSHFVWREAKLAEAADRAGAQSVTAVLSAAENPAPGKASAAITARLSVERARRECPARLSGRRAGFGDATPGSRSAPGGHRRIKERIARHSPDWARLGPANEPWRQSPRWQEPC